MDLGHEYLLYYCAVCVSTRYGEIYRSQALILPQSKSNSKKVYNFKTSHDTFLKYSFLVWVGWPFLVVFFFTWFVK